MDPLIASCLWDSGFISFRPKGSKKKKKKEKITLIVGIMQLYLPVTFWMA